MKSLVEQLKALKTIKHDINPDANFVRTTKTELMTRISATKVEQQRAAVERQQTVQQKVSRAWDLGHVLVPQTFARAMRPMVTAALALLLTTGGWIASAYAAPGDTLWQAKAAVGSVIERGQLALSDDTGDVELNLKFASKRAQVIKEVADRPDISPEKKKKIIQDSAAGIEKNILDAEIKIDTVDVEKSPDLIKDVSLKTKEITTTLKETAQKVEGEKQDVVFAEDLTTQAEVSTQKSLSLVEKAVQKKVDAQKEISEEEIFIIRDHIDTLVADIERDATKAKEHADTLVETVEKNTLDFLNASTTTSSGIEEVTTTLDIDISEVSTTLHSTTTTENTIISIDDGEKNPEEVAKDIQERATNTVTNVAEQKTQVEQLVDVDIVEALKKTRELTDSVTETVREVSDATKEVLPQVEPISVDSREEDVEEIDDEVDVAEDIGDTTL